MSGPIQEILLYTASSVDGAVLVWRRERLVTREEIYHLAASGLFREIKLTDLTNGRPDWIDGAAMARLVEAVNVERASKIAVTVELKAAPKVVRAKAVRS